MARRKHKNKRNNSAEQSPAGHWKAPTTPPARKPKMVTVAEKILTSYELDHYRVIETFQTCQGCGTVNSILNPEFITAVFVNPQGHEKHLGPDALKKAYEAYYGPDCGMPVGKLKVQSIWKEVPWCGMCSEDWHGTQHDCVKLPAIVTHEVLDTHEEELREKLAAKQRKAPAKPKPAPLSDADFFNSI